MASPGYPFFFTWTAQQDAQPMPMTGGEGAYFFGDGGERWLDLGSLSYQASLGHGEQRVVEAIRTQASELCLSAPSAVFPAKVALAKKLLALSPPGFSKVFFTLGGAEANENALKIARMATGRHKVLSRYRSYHGATMGALSLTGDWRRPPLEPGMAGAVHVLDFDCGRCPHGVRSRHCDHEPLTQIPRVLELEGPGSVAAVFLEPVPGANGVLIPPPGYLRSVREACDRHGTLLVFDEVLTGFGRTGRWFGFEHWDVVPDMITVAKGLTAGYATLGAVLVHERVAAHFEQHALVAGLTFYGHPLAMAAGLAAISVYEEDGLIERAARLSPVLETWATGLCNRRPGCRQARVIGMLAGVELETDRAGFARLGHALRARRIFAHVHSQSGVLVLAPPLCIPEDALRSGLEQVEAALEEALHD